MHQSSTAQGSSIPLALHTSWLGQQSQVTACHHASRRIWYTAAGGDSSMRQHVQRGQLPICNSYRSMLDSTVPSPAPNSSWLCLLTSDQRAHWPAATQEGQSTSLWISNYAPAPPPSCTDPRPHSGQLLPPSAAQGGRHHAAHQERLSPVAHRQRHISPSSATSI